MDNNIHINRNTGRLYANPIMGTRNNNPEYFNENYKDRTIFKDNNNNYKNATQNNKINFDTPNNNVSFVYEDQYKNKPLIDNNLNEEIRSEYIDERDIIIDTIDRDLTAYPNIFNFRLKLGSTETTLGPSVHRSINYVKYIKLLRAIFPDNYYIAKNEFNSNNYSQTDLKSVIIEYLTTVWSTIYNSTSGEYFDDTYSTTIASGSSAYGVDTSYKIYIIHHYYDGTDFSVDFYLDSLYAGSTDTNSPDYQTVYSAVYNNPTSSIDSSVSNWLFYYYAQYADTKIEQGRYFQLHIDQLPKNNDLATNSSVSKSFALLFPGKEDTRGFNYLDGYETDKIFKFSNLGSFSNFSIQITDATGELLETNTNIWNSYLDNYSNSKKILNENTNTNSNFKYSFRSANKYIRHPLSWRQQATFIFNIGEVNIELNKKVYN